jgi:hypothetical protein
MEKTMQYAITMIVALSGCIFSSCGCDFIAGKRETNPSGKYSAFTEGSSCGATSPYESSVQIEKPYSVFGRRVWTSRQGIFRATVDLDQLKLQWTDDHRLLVACHCKREAVIFNDSRWRDMTIEYTFLQ